jgi:hypothetical protein
MCFHKQGSLKKYLQDQEAIRFYDYDCGLPLDLCDWFAIQSNSAFLVCVSSSVPESGASSGRVSRH